MSSTRGNHIINFGKRFKILMHFVVAKQHLKSKMHVLTDMFVTPTVEFFAV